MDDPLNLVQVYYFSLTSSPSVPKDVEQCFDSYGIFKVKASKNDFEKSSLINVANYKIKNSKIIPKLQNDVCEKISFDKDTHCWLKFPFLSKDDPYLNEKVPLKSFALGSLFGLNDFTMHFSSEDMPPPRDPPPELRQKILTNQKDPKIETKITNINAKFDPILKRITVDFLLVQEYCSKKEIKIIKFDIDYNSIKWIVVHKQNIFYLILHHPPMFYVGNLYVDGFRCGSKKHLYEEDEKEDEKEEYNIEPDNYLYAEDIKKWHRKIDLGEKLCPKLICGLSKVLKLEFSPTKKFNSKAILHTLQRDYYFGLIREAKSKHHEIPYDMINNFDCYYALKCLVTYSFNLQDEFSLKTNKQRKEIKEKLSKYSNECPAALALALYDIYNDLEEEKIIIIFKSLFENYEKHKNKETCDFIDMIPNKTIKIRRAIVFPSHVRFLPPHPYRINRIFREFDSEYGLRIIIRDINMENLCITAKGVPQSVSELIENHIKDNIKSLTIGNRIYEFVGCSSSQLRDSGALLYAKDSENRTAENISQSIGNLNNLRTVPKYMARMGQSFSQSFGNIIVPRSCIEEENDIPGGINPANNKPFEFSDGIGQISQDLISKMYNKLDFLKEGREPSAFQIRYGGYKGMLALNPKLPGEKIIFRRSMNKFESPSESLEILKCTKPRLVYLNQQFITILEYKGIKPSVFRNLQNKAFINFFNIFRDEEKAREFLSKANFLNLPYRSLINFNISLTREPFFRSLLLAIIKDEIAGIKEKARIPIPPDKGRAMLGVLDETGYLKAGQVFVSYSTNFTQYKKFDPVTILNNRTVLVTRHPCMAAGDVRKFEAVDVEDLHHLIDCIVFPRVGERPHPNEMGGGDLDGDEFVVIWDDDLIFEKDNDKAMIFPCPTIETKPDTITVDDMVNFFCNYLQNDKVGKVAKAHLAWADRLDKSITSKKCEELAEQYAVALDFAKTGVPSTKPSFLPNECPDFMQVHHKESYLSTKVLGDLFRECEIVEACLDFTSTAVHLASMVDPDLEYPGWQNYEAEAKDELANYEAIMDTILLRFGISGEGEALSGFTTYAKFLDGRQEKFDFPETLGLLFGNLFEMLRKNIERYEAEEEKLKFVSALYMLTHKGTTKYFGLPWIYVNEILKIKVSKTSNLNEENRVKNSFLVEKLTNILNDSPIPAGDTKSLPDTIDYIICNWLKHNESLLSSLGTSIKVIQHIASKLAKKTTKLWCRSQKSFKTGLLVLKILELYIKLSFTYLDHSIIKMKGKLLIEVFHLRNLAVVSQITLLKMGLSYEPTIHLGLSEKTEIITSPLADEADDFIYITAKDDFLDTVSTKTDKVKDYLLELIPLSKLEIKFRPKTSWLAIVYFIVKGSTLNKLHFKWYVTREEFKKEIEKQTFTSTEEIFQDASEVLFQFPLDKEAINL